MENKNKNKSQELEKDNKISPKKRTLKEMNLMNNCGNHYWVDFSQLFDEPLENKNGFSKFYLQYGYKNCCICSFCEISCGEEINANWYEKNINEKKEKFKMFNEEERLKKELFIAKESHFHYRKKFNELEDKYQKLVNFLLHKKINIEFDQLKKRWKFKNK